MSLSPSENPQAKVSEYIDKAKEIYGQVKVITSKLSLSAAKTQIAKLSKLFDNEMISMPYSSTSSRYRNEWHEQLVLLSRKNALPDQVIIDHVHANIAGWELQISSLHKNYDVRKLTELYSDFTYLKQNVTANNSFFVSSRLKLCSTQLKSLLTSLKPIQVLGEELLKSHSAVKIPVTDNKKKPFEAKSLERPPRLNSSLSAPLPLDKPSTEASTQLSAKPAASPATLASSSMSQSGVLSPPPTKSPKSGDEFIAELDEVIGTKAPSPKVYALTQSPFAM